MRWLRLALVLLFSSTAPAQNYYVDVHDSSVQTGRYRITFSSFPPQAGHPVGHAFVTWQQETPAGLITIGVFGFYPTVSNAFMVVWEDGLLHSELQSTIDLADRSVSFRVDQSQFANSLAIRNAWQAKPPVYTIDGNNCVDFVVQMGNAIGIAMPDHGPLTHLLPDSYMKTLMDQLEDGKLQMKDGDSITVGLKSDYTVGSFRQPIDGSDPVFSGRQKTTTDQEILEANYNHGSIIGPATTWYPDGRTWYRDDSADPTVSVMVYQNGNLLIGYDPNTTIQNAKMYNSGSVYNGLSQNGHPNGQGILTTSNGVTYAGTFVNGDEVGTGEMTFPNGQVATGQFSGGKLMSGRVRFPDGTYVEGKRDASGNFGVGADIHNSDGTIHAPDSGTSHGSPGVAHSSNKDSPEDKIRSHDIDFTTGRETTTVEHSDHTTEKIERDFPPADGNLGDHN